MKWNWVAAGLALALLGACADEPEPEPKRKPVTVDLRPESTKLAVGARLRLDARALDRHGVVIPEAKFRFVSSDPSVAAVDPQGWVEARGPGEAELLARTGRLESRTRIAVRPRIERIEIHPPSPILLEDEVVQLAFTLLGGEGAPIHDELEPRWRSEDGTIAKVSKEGLLTAVAPGETRIVVAAGEGEGSIDVRVEPRAHTIELEANADELVAGESLLVRVRVFDRRGAELERPLEWTAADPEVARVEPDGRVHALAPGATSIVAEADGAVGELPLRVLPAAEEIEILAPDTRIYAGASSLWTTRAYDAAGNLLEGRRAIWSSDTPEVATVEDTGRVRGHEVGIATITARSGRAKAQATVEVFPHAELVVRTAPPPRLEPEFTAPVEAEVVGPQPLPLRWTSSAPEVAVVAKEEVRMLTFGKTVIAVESGGLRHEFPVAGSLRFQSLAAGGEFACGLTEEARIWCWGDNAFGQLGNGGSEASHRPVRPLLDPSLSYRAITAGLHHACALTDEGRAFCWGDNRSGGLGADTEEPHADVPLPSLPEERFASLSAGDPPFRNPLPDEGAHTCGLTVDGRALCWGNGRVGQMGTGETPAVSPPVEPAGGHVFVELLASAGYTCGIDDDARVRCWGYGPLGTPDDIFDGPLMGSTTPRLALVGHPDKDLWPFVPKYVSSLALGQLHACGITPQGDAYCWGDRTSYATSQSGYAWTPLGIAFKPVGGLWSQVAGGSTSGCGIDPNGSIYCWGRDIGLGDPSFSCRKPYSYLPAPVLPDIRVRGVAMGRRYCEDYVCALDDEGIARCWGSNTAGQVGRPASPRVEEPTPLFPDAPGD